MSEETAEDTSEMILIKMHMTDLEEMTAERAELEGMVKSLYTEVERDELESIEKRVSELTARGEVLHGQVRERDEQIFEDLRIAASEIGRKEAALKAACYSLPIDSFKKTQRFKEGKLRISVGTARVSTTYRSAIIDEYPQLNSMSADGDPAVKLSVDSAVLERLIAEDKFSAEDAKDFRIDAKARNPSVRITWAEE